MDVWRIAAETDKYAADSLCGSGAAAKGGRWNSVGKHVLYCSDSVSLACLETLVHFNTLYLPVNRILVKVSIQTAVWKKRTVITEKNLAVGWNIKPHGIESITVGDKWISSNTSAVLVVPSSIIPEDNIIVINPHHPDAKHVTAKKIKIWHYDQRFLSTKTPT